MDVSIIIVNYNTEKLILDCLDSIYEKTERLDFEVIVVDNDSPNKSEILKSDNRIKYIQSEKNLGFGKANNLGAEYAQGEYLFCLNPDTLLINNAIKILYDYISKKREVGICGGNLFYIDGSPMHSYRDVSPGIFNEILILTKNFCGLYKNNEFNTSQKIVEVSYVTGADLMISKELFNKIGGFDKDFFMYFEETYLCYQVKKRGYKIVNIPEAKIIHLESQCFSFRKEKENLYYQGRSIYLKKRFNIIYYVICNIIHCLTCISRILIFSLNKNKRNMWLYRLKVLLF